MSYHHGFIYLLLYMFYSIYVYKLIYIYIYIDTQRWTRVSGSLNTKTP